MESELTFVAPEGVYSLTEDHKSIPIAHTVPHPLYPTRLSTITVRFPATKQPAIQGLGQLLGGGKDFWKEKGLAPTPAAKDDGGSVSSGDTPEDVTSPDVGGSQDATTPTSIVMPDQNHGLFGPPAGGKRRALSRPKHNMRTTSSTFISRLQSVEGLAKVMQAKQGEVTYLFYNSAKNFYWVEAGVQAKVRLTPCSLANVTPSSCSPYRKLWLVLHLLRIRHVTT
jgi:catabolite repression protein CreC